MAGRWDEEDWSLALAEQGAADAAMEDVNSGAPGILQLAFGLWTNKNKKIKRSKKRRRKERVLLAAKCNYYDVYSHKHTLFHLLVSVREERKKQLEQRKQNVLAGMFSHVVLPFTFYILNF